MPGFPTELRPLLALVIVLAIAHMLLKVRSRRARARSPRLRRSRARTALAAMHRGDASIEGASSAFSPGLLEAQAPWTGRGTTSTSAQHADADPDLDPALALHRLRLQATTDQLTPGDPTP